MKTSLGIWAMGPMVTRFNPGGYKPELAGRSTAEHVRTAVAGLGDMIDDYEFHHPQELSDGNLDEVREALGGHGIHAIASGLHLDSRFARGGLSSPDLALDGIGEAAVKLAEHDQVLLLEHKNSEPAMKIHMGNIGMTLHVIHTLRARGIGNVQVNMDWQHLLMNGENLAEYAALLAAEGLLGHQHANSGWGTFDDDNMVGATAFMETLELAVELRRAGYGTHGERLGFDLYPYTEDAVDVVRRSVLQWRFIDGAAARIDDAALREAQRRKDAIGAYELVYAALGA
jgi:xylose isomerase